MVTQNYFREIFDQALGEASKDHSSFFTLRSVITSTNFDHSEEVRNMFLSYFKVLINHNDRCNRHVFSDRYRRIVILTPTELVIIKKICEDFLTDSQAKLLSNFMKQVTVTIAEDFCIPPNIHISDYIIINLLYLNGEDLYENIEECIENSTYLTKNEIIKTLLFCSHFNEDAEYLLNLITVKGNNNV